MDKEKRMVSTDYMDGMLTVLYAIAELTCRGEAKFPIVYGTHDFVTGQTKEFRLDADMGKSVFENIVSKIKKEYKFGEIIKTYTREQIEYYRDEIIHKIELVKPVDVVSLIRTVPLPRERDDY